VFAPQHVEGKPKFGGKEDLTLKEKKTIDEILNGQMDRLTNG
jgi:hypothetical protein